MDFKKILYGEISFEPELRSCETNNNNNKNQDTNNDNGLQIHSKEFQVPKHQLSDPNLVKLNWLQSEKIGSGLINVGNTCFLNSVIQCLTYCAPLYNFLVKCDGGHSRNCKLNAFCMLCEMEKLVKKIRSSTGTSIKPVSIVQRLKYINKTFQFGRQEDAHEFLRYLIDHMWKACLMNLNISPKIDPRIKETTIINHIFGGYHRSQVHCLTCNSRSDTYDFFMEFMLDIRNAKSLEDALRRFTQAEKLENENAYKCSTCRKKVAAKKKFTVYEAPNVATFQLKRFDSDRIFSGKITKFISYPEELDLRPFMSDTSKPSIKYQLTAVLVHLGHSSNSGHYFCFIKNSNNFWYRMDDSNVTLVTSKNVLEQQAYVLFYTRKQPQQQINNNVKPPISTWNGSRSSLEDECKPEQIKNRDRFNDELDRGKRKKTRLDGYPNNNNNDNMNNHNHNNNQNLNNNQNYNHNNNNLSNHNSNNNNNNVNNHKPFQNGHNHYGKNNNHNHPHHHNNKKRRKENFSKSFHHHKFNSNKY